MMILNEFKFYFEINGAHHRFDIPNLSKLLTRYKRQRRNEHNYGHEEKIAQNENHRHNFPYDRPKSHVQVLENKTMAFYHWYRYMRVL